MIYTEKNQHLVHISWLGERADVIEVIEALKKLPDYVNVEELRKKKSEEREAFNEKIILKGEKS